MDLHFSAGEELLIEAGVDLAEMAGYPEWGGSALDLGWAVNELWQWRC